MITTNHNSSGLPSRTMGITSLSEDWIGEQIRLIRQGVEQKQGQNIEKINQACQSWETLLDHGLTPATIHHLADTTPADLMFLRYYAITPEK